MRTELKEYTLYRTAYGKEAPSKSPPVGRLLKISKILTKQYNTMHIAYSALRTKPKKGKAELNDAQLTERYQAYQTACNKYRAEIAAIQQYMPGWMPPFERKAER